MASLFIIGRLAFGVGYIIGTITKIQTFRAFGMIINTFMSVAMALYFLGFNLITKA